MTETLRVFAELPALRARLKAARSQGQRIGLIPTMGNLHAGHLALVETAREHCDYLLATIFVNPLQFGPSEDFERYPRTFAADVQALQSVGCDAVFVPTVSDIYPQGLAKHTRISVPELSTLHCGASRPGHFDGVCTVVNMLFNMIQPNLAVFGLKDYQQFCIISKMVNDLHMPVQLQGVPTVREASGLALSSRNGFLSTAEKHSAASIHATLQQTAAQIKQNQRDFSSHNNDSNFSDHSNYSQLEQAALEQLQQAGLRPDYFHICNSHTLLAASAQDTDLVLLVAAYAGSTRLIDNLLVQVTSL